MRAETPVFSPLPSFLLPTRPLGVCNSPTAPDVRFSPLVSRALDCRVSLATDLGARATQLAKTLVFGRKHHGRK